MFSGFQATNANYTAGQLAVQGRNGPAGRSKNITCRSRQSTADRAEELTRHPPPRDHDAAASKLRLPDHAPPLRPLHAGDGGACHRLSARDVLAGLRSAGPQMRRASAPARSVTPWAGRITASASRSSAPRRSFRACWAISAGRAAAFWRCAGMSASRAAQTSRRCTTCCRPICRSPTRSTRMASLEEYPRDRDRADRLVEQPAEIRGQLLKAWYGAHARAPTSGFATRSFPN